MSRPAVQHWCYSRKLLGIAVTVLRLFSFVGAPADALAESDQSGRLDDVHGVRIEFPLEPPAGIAHQVYGDEFQDSPLRTWTDRSGQHRIDARLVGYENGKVLLKQADGADVAVPLTYLSERDKDYLKAFRDQLKEQRTAENRAKGPLNRKAAAGNRNLQAPDEGHPIDMRGNAPWNFVPDPPPAAAPLAESELILGRPPGLAMEPIEMLLAPGSGCAYIVYASHTGGKNKPPILVQVCDLQHRKILRVGETQGNEIPIDVSWDGSYLLARANQRNDKTHTLEQELNLYDLGGERARPLGSWRPYKSDRASEGHVQWAQIIDVTQVASLSTDGELAVWSIPESRRVYSLSIYAQSIPALSPSRKQIAVQTDDGITILEAATGKSLGQLPVDFCDLGPSVAAFDRTGRRLALYQPGRMMVLQLVPPKLEREFPARGIYAAHKMFAADTGGRDRLVWVSDNKLLLAGQHLIDIDRRVALWDYPNRSNKSAIHSPQRVSGERLWMIVPDQNRLDLQLRSARLPHKVAKAVAARLDPVDLLEIRPGMEISIDLRLAGRDRSYGSYYDVLVEKLQNNGMKVVDHSDVVLVRRQNPRPLDVVRDSWLCRFGVWIVSGKSLDR